MAGRVCVFGAGISGLTAAHELVERGFEVVVFERDEDPRHLAAPAIGGLARTQWAVPTQGPRGGERPPRVRAAEPLVKAIQVELAGRDDTDTLADGANAALTAFLDELQRRYGGVPPLRVIGNVGGVPPIPNDVALARARTVEEALRVKGASSIGLSTGPVDDDRGGPRRVEVRVHEGAQLAAEHGFRYFPAFYRHVFDTMRRIRLLDDHTSPTARPYGTVLDNLVPTLVTNLAMEKPRRGLSVPREAPRSLREVQVLLRRLVANAGYTPEDVDHLSRKLVEYMTAGPKRRRTYEDTSFWDFMEGDRLSPFCAHDLNLAPQVLIGMVAKECDARTQGNCVVQLLLGQLTGTKYTDATLNGPTSSVWLAPWRDYLQALGVQFRLGHITGFRLEGSRIVPTLAGAYRMPEWRPDDYFVLAVPVPALRDLCPQFLACVHDAGGALPGGAGDFGPLGAWLARLPDWNTPEGERAGPLRNMSGIQFFFRYDVEPTRGHTLYLDSAWRLSSISQLSFWTRPPAPSDACRGIVSIDVGAWNLPGTSDRTAWQSTRDQIADEVLAQIRRSVTLPDPHDYHLDEHLELDADGKPARNCAPYLVSRPGEWQARPGEPGNYQLGAGRWVIAGTFMKTYTRLTTMESANESARHAVNALLRAVDYQGVPCDTFDPEAYELPDLTWLKELDDHLVDAGLPQALRILEPPSILAKLLPALLGDEEASAIDTTMAAARRAPAFEPPPAAIANDASFATLNAALRGILGLVGSAVLFDAAEGWLDKTHLQWERDEPAKRQRVTHGRAGSWDGQPDASCGAELGRHVRTLVEAGTGVGVPAAAAALLRSPAVLPAAYGPEGVSFPEGAAGAQYVFYSKPSVPVSIPWNFETLEGPAEPPGEGARDPAEPTGSGTS
jgi:uncharacterized protein with NAD-binding domain and iron-sulfur cluster